jgi:hypothetical protein
VCRCQDHKSRAGSESQPDAGMEAHLGKGLAEAALVLSL